MNIRADEVHLWFLLYNNVVEPEYFKLYTALISQTERMEMERLLFSRNRRQFLLARVLARTVLSTYFPFVCPGEWAFKRSVHGRPYIFRPLGISLDFNISHTDGLIILGISKGRMVGVDAEYCNHRRELLKKAQMYLSLEEANVLESLPVQHQLQRAYQLWTLKEAFFKACGVRRATSLKELSFNLSTQNGIKFTTKELTCDPRDWRFWQIAPCDSYEVAIALQCNDKIDGPVSLKMHSINPFQMHEKILFPVMNRDAPSL